MSTDPIINPTAEVGSDVEIGARTRVWHYAQIRDGVRIGRDCILGRDVYIDEEIVIGDNVKIQNRVSIYRDCVIEDGVFIGPHVVFTNDQFPRAINPDGTLKSATDWHAGSTRVCRGASIGASAVILPSKTIGQYALVGAGSVVTKDVGDFHIVLGNPARLAGFACVCGHKLLHQESATLLCASCHLTYELSSGNEVKPGQGEV